MEYIEQPGLSGCQWKRIRNIHVSADIPDTAYSKREIKPFTIRKRIPPLHHLWKQSNIFPFAESFKIIYQQSFQDFSPLMEQELLFIGGPPCGNNSLFFMHNLAASEWPGALSQG
jgi:hypothetical protein